MKRLNLHARRGFTLVEVLCALVIFSVALVGFMQSLAAASKTQGDLYDEQRAMMLAQNILEEMRYSGSFEVGTEEGEFQPPDQIFAWRTEIEEDATVAELMKITATVSWVNGVQRESSLSTLVSGTEMGGGAAAGGGASASTGAPDAGSAGQ